MTECPLCRHGEHEGGCLVGVFRDGGPIPKPCNCYPCAICRGRGLLTIGITTSNEEIERRCEACGGTGWG